MCKNSLQDSVMVNCYICSQSDCTDWVETCIILISGVGDCSVELSVRQAEPSSSSDVPVSPADSLQSLVRIQLKCIPHEQT